MQCHQDDLKEFQWQRLVIQLAKNHPPHSPSNTNVSLKPHTQLTFAELVKKNSNSKEDGPILTQMIQMLWSENSTSQTNSSASAKLDELLNEFAAWNVAHIDSIKPDTTLIESVIEELTKASQNDIIKEKTQEFIRNNILKPEQKQQPADASIKEEAKKIVAAGGIVTARQLMVKQQTNSFAFI